LSDFPCELAKYNEFQEAQEKAFLTNEKGFNASKSNIEECDQWYSEVQRFFSKKFT